MKKFNMGFSAPAPVKIKITWLVLQPSFVDQTNTHHVQLDTHNIRHKNDNISDKDNDNTIHKNK